MSRPTALLALVAALVAATFAVPVTASAHWTAEEGGGDGQAQATDLTAATISTPATSTGSNVVTWTAQARVTTDAAAGTVTYNVERALGAGSFAPIGSGACAGDLPRPTTSCTDVVGGSGTYRYRVVADLGDSWTATSNVASITTTVDTAFPTASLTRASPTPSNAASLAWTVTFTEPVTGVDVSDFSVVPAATVTGASITSVTGGGATWTVTVNTGSGNGTLGLNLTDDDSIADGAGNRLGGSGAGNGSVTGPTYTLDRVAPTSSTLTRSTTATNVSSLTWSATFSESVSGVDATDFALVTTGTLTGVSITSVTGSGTSRTVTVSTGAGDGTIGLNLVDDDTIRDTATNPLGGTGAGNGNRTGSVVTIDRTAPVLSSLLMNDSNTNGKVNQVVATFSETLAATPALASFTLANIPSAGTYASIARSGATVTLTITEGAGAADTAVNSFTVALAASATGVRDVAGNQASFAARAPTDNARPRVMSLTDTNGATDGRIEPGDTLTALFSEPLKPSTINTAPTITVARAATGNATLTVTGLTNGTPTLGATGYLNGNNRSAVFAGSAAQSGSSVTVTVGACSTGCGNVATQASAAGLVLGPAATLTDLPGLTALTTTVTYTARVF